MTEGRQPFTAEIKTLAKGPSTYDPLENDIRQEGTLRRSTREKDNPVTRMSKRWRAPALKRRYNEVHEAGSLSTS